MSDALLAVRGLRKYFGRPERPVRAVDDVSFEIAKGEVLGLVGESGSGKSTIGRSVVKLIDPSKGEIRFAGTDLAPLSPRAMRPYRRRLQIIFQDPYASLNPRQRVGATLDEALATHGLHPARRGRNALRSYCRLSVSRPSMRSAIRTNFRAVSGSASASHAPSPSSPNSSSRTSRCRLSTFRFRRR
jgi:ABC-type glutathione transport system ATPase component